MSATIENKKVVELEGGDKGVVLGSLSVPVKMDEQELVRFLGRIKGATFLSFQSDTEADLYRREGGSRKQDARANPFKKGTVRKRQRINAALNVSYGRAVNRQREREGSAADFKAEPRKWGESLRGLPFVVHTKKDGTKGIYLEAMALRCLEKPVYYEAETGTVIPYSAIKPFIKKGNTGKQELHKPVIWRTFKLESILGLKANRMEIVPGWK